MLYIPLLLRPERLTGLKEQTVKKLEKLLEKADRKKHEKLLKVEFWRILSERLIQLWWAKEDLNLRPLACKASALPLSYSPPRKIILQNVSKNYLSISSNKFLHKIYGTSTASRVTAL